MHTLRILILHVTTLLVSVPVAILAGNAEPFSFIAMADSRGVDNGVNDAVLSTIVDLILQEDAEFIVFPGDLVTGSSDPSTLASQLNHWRDVMAPVYSSDMHGAKIYAGPGNHEIRDAASEGVWQSIFSELPSNGPPGETYMTYSFDYLNAHFVMLDTNRAGSPHTVNYDWLANDLAGVTASHVFVFGHEPAYPAGPHLGSSLDAYPAQRDAFWQLLADYEVDVYFAGHEHLYNHTEVDGVHQVIAGTCGAPIYSGYGGDFYHFALVTVDGPAVSVEVIDDYGETRDHFEYGQPECSDGIDNDGDGLVDYPEDPSCRNADTALEDAACQDGIDNDGDGLIDFDGGLSIFGAGDPRITAPDPQCASSYRTRETPYPSACGLGIELALLLVPLMWLSLRTRMANG
jgi:predicted phosphodiesterase